ncbi:MAG: hypothetical protein L0H79_12575 [Intrasporangium sp.]|uniref:hypothetical protein n=1 Tax=Intrasporangium sp. TaxID=1925024 RepID=UPI0026473994|nr:hypothetical protein [Intrasporangium sp.]MDN5796574.1 hypothetical protein [Intrasporangium sp.]
MNRRMWPAAASALAVVALLGGCGLGFGDEMIGGQATTVGAGPAVPEPPTRTDQGHEVGPTGASGAGGTASQTAPASGSRVAGVTEVRDGAWDVGDAGQVKFLVKDGQLELMSVTPAGGWQQTPPVKQPDDLEVRFTQAPTTWSFQVRLRDGSMTISKEKSIARAGDGSYPVGAAGSVSFTTSGSGLKLGDVVTENGWTATTQPTPPSSISVSFGDGAKAASFTATQAQGAVTVSTRSELSGPVPTS